MRVSRIGCRKSEILLMMLKMSSTLLFLKQHINEVFMGLSRDSPPFSPNLIICTKSGCRSKQSRPSSKTFPRIFQLLKYPMMEKALAQFSRCSNSLEGHTHMSRKRMLLAWKLARRMS
ncbi:hypothetical protein ES332_D10G304000v1 [Gossypium tomentosum]|uniref:Uncharacterized protein n=1 Tax=Gossypium tomentosum TaxID=34277 RepID=A0A5D2JBK8_GOSTO|nr:hypothetical protein ES332_D10G304000v1 [Gossypium tomentosum]